MNTTSKLRIAALATVLGLGVAVGAAGPGLAQMMGSDGHGGRGHHAGFHGPRADRIDGRVAYLKAELKITDAQQAQWNAFEQVLRQNAAEQKAQGEKMRAEMQAKRAEMEKAREEAKAKGTQPALQKRPSAVEQMERRQTFMKAHLDNQAKVLAAFKPLYASLTDDQKKTADEVFGGHGGRGGPGHFRR